MKTVIVKHDIQLINTATYIETLPYVLVRIPIYSKYNHPITLLAYPYPECSHIYVCTKSTKKSRTGQRLARIVSSP